MKLTVLGSSASYPGAGQACAGHLIEGGRRRVMVDCGNGTLANLGRVCDPLDLDAVIITHAHIDHFADVYALQSLLRYAPDGPAPPLPLYAPPGLFERMGRVLTDHGAAELVAAFSPAELQEGGIIDLGGMTVTPHAVEHIRDTFALVFEADGARLCYTSDTRLSEPIAAAASGADVLLAEATMPEAYAGRAAHMTAAEAGELAAGAGVRTLVLAHLWPTTPRTEILEQASAVFDGEIVVSEEMTSLDV